LRELSVLIKETGARRKSNQRPHGIHKRHDEDGEHHGKCAPGERAAKIQLPHNWRDAWRYADQAMRRRGDLGNERHNSRDDNAQQNRAGNFSDHEHGNQPAKL
jgi:hypothetical protein